MPIALAINALVVGGLVAALWSASPLLGPRRSLEGDKGLPYETGMPPLDSAVGRTWVSYYRFAVLFVVYDVDLAFLIPWVWMRGALSLGVMVSLTVFLLLVGLMTAYLWRKGALECR